jgi:hypothetical protein
MERIGRGLWYVIDEIDLAAMAADHAALDRLCDRLEDVADTLPRPLSHGVALQLCHELERLPPSHEVRERALFARLFGIADQSPCQAAALWHIRRRWGSHVVQAQDLAAVLQPGESGLSPATFGYMLRCFFEGCRADMAFEELALLTFAGECLTPAARALLELSLEARCRA